jgi:hypothetical protein
MDCNECNRLHTEAAFSWQTYRGRKRLNQSARSPSDADLKQQEDLLRAYGLAAARQRVHRGRVHPEHGCTVRFEDLRLVAGNGSEC